MMDSTQTLHERLTRLQQQYDLETRVEEQMRLEALIADTRQHLLQRLQQEAHRRKGNGAYCEAMDVWHEILQHQPNDSVATQALAELEQMLAQTTQVTELVKVLSRIKAIRPLFKELSTALKQPSHTAEYQTLWEQVRFFLDTAEPDVEGFMLWWEEERPCSQTSVQNVDSARLAARVQRGEMVLFLGSGIASNYADTGQHESEWVQQLARHIGYETFNGTLSSIAEYYQLRPDFGQSALLENLRTQLPDNVRQVLLYQALAKVSAPLILISAAYDTLLEQSLREAGKRFVEFASIVRRSEDYDIGHVLVSFSDNSQPPQVYPEEALSRLRLLENGYSIVYKIRGTCGVADSEQEDVRRDALTLSESNYFSFARYADKMIPGYLARQLRNRGFLFVGYRPREWEDRLLASALLEKRSSQEPCYVIGETPEPLEAVYWESRNVKQYRIGIRELDRYLLEVGA
ncbi:MAG TPA: SIR2 family protein [Candidatus Thiothrix moscowensis]|uniref:SIR2 family protein n=1 Tax=unclassified Thiothrix TaxID=2636184 RepID=UPI0025EF7FCB|nr:MULTISPECIES: SIR2 family protein [unclassified Thiothrix]HRJ53453.1 SIR2 family protein [Candidatus Thiothrix moscowensis]HRJ93532.1 SIR2 family protein [Candidatus Thiothrix moscowensis]